MSEKEGRGVRIGSAVGEGGGGRSMKNTGHSGVLQTLIV